jgi:hypothetical protein
LNQLNLQYVLDENKLFFSIFIFYLKSERDSNYHSQTDKSAGVFSETTSTSKNNNDDDDDDDDNGIPTNSALNYNQQSEEIQMPPAIEDVHDIEEEEEEEEKQQGESANELSSPEIAQRQKESLTPSEKTEERQKSSSSRPKTAPSIQSHSKNEESKSSRSSSTTSSDDTSALLRSDNDNDNSQNLSDDELNNEEEQVPIETPIKSDHSSPDISDTMNIVDQENISPQPIDKLSQRDVKGEYDPSQVMQLKESFQPIINEAASYGHIDVVRDLIEVFFIQIYFSFHYINIILYSVVKVFTHKIYYNVHLYMKHVLVVMDNLYLNFLIKKH